MRLDIPFEGRRHSVCQGCGIRTLVKDGFCDRCRALGLGIGRDRYYTDNLTDEEKARKKEFERLQELKKRETEKEPTDEELAEILKKRTQIYDGKKRGDKNQLPESVDATFKA